jgi:hypothetical protein
MFNLYAEIKIAEQRRAELEERAEHERTVQKLVRWIKQEHQEATKAAMQMPEVTIYEN